MIEEKPKKKGWVKILFIILPYFITVGVFELIGALTVGVDLMNPTNPMSSFQHLIMKFSNLVGTLLLLWIFMRFVDREKFIELGFQTKGRLKDFIVGNALGLSVISIGFLVLLGINELSVVAVNFNFKELVITLLLFVFVAVVEEVLVRGYILKNLMQSMNKYIALVLSSLLFFAMHLFNPNIDLMSSVVLFLAGIMLGLSYVYTKNLWFPIGLHLSWNFSQAFFGFNVSGLDIYRLVETKIEEPTLLNGGAFGFEGSILCVIAQVLSIGAIAYYYLKQEKQETVSVG